MPNWCRNWLRVTAEAGNAAGEAQLADFRRTLLGRPRSPGPFRGGGLQLDLRPVFPPPPQLALNSAEEKAWIVKHYATYSDLFEVEVTLDTPTALHLSGGTRWTPPYGWVLGVSGRYPLLDFQLDYCERSAGLIGRLGMRGAVPDDVYREAGRLRFPDFDAFVLHDGESAAAACVAAADAFLAWPAAAAAADGADSDCAGGADVGARARAAGALGAALKAAEAELYAALEEATGEDFVTEAPMADVRAALGAIAPPLTPGGVAAALAAAGGDVEAGARVAAGAILRDGCAPWQGEETLDEAEAISAVLARVRAHLRSCGA